MTSETTRVPPEATVVSDIGPDVGDAHPSILRNMAHLMSSQVVGWVLGTAAQLVVPRFLGPVGLGQLRLAFSVGLIAQVFMTLGTASYVTLEFARDRKRGAALVGPVTNLRIAAFAVTAVVVGGYLAASGANGMAWALFGVVGSTILLQVIGDVLSAALTGMEQMKYPALAGVISKFAYVTVMVVVLFLGGGVVSIAAATTFNMALSLVLLAHYYRKFERISFARAAIGYRAIIRSSVPFMLVGAIVVVYMQVDTIMISALVDERTLGWYSTADVLYSSLVFVPVIVMGTLFPVIGRLHVSDTEASASIIRRAFSMLFLAGVAIGFGTFVVAEPVSVLLYGEAFRESGDVLAVLGLTVPLLFGTMMLGTVAMATEKQAFWNKLMAVAVVLSIALDLVLVPWTRDVAHNGALGGALAYVVTEGLMVCVGVWHLAPETFKGDSLIRLLKILVAGGLLVVAAWPLREQFLLVPIAVGAVVFVAATYAFGILTDDERDILRRLGARVGITRGGREDTGGPPAGDGAPMSINSGGP